MAKQIPVGRTPKSAYNPKRKVSALLAAQVENLKQVTKRKFGETSGGKPRTEAGAADYIARMTRLLHPAPVADVPAALPVAAPATSTGSSVKEKTRKVAAAPTPKTTKTSRVGKRRASTRASRTR